MTDDEIPTSAPLALAREQEPVSDHAEHASNTDRVVAPVQITYGIFHQEILCIVNSLTR